MQKMKKRPIMVASYERCEDVRKQLARIFAEIGKCAVAYANYRRKGLESYKEILRKEVEEILNLDARIYELERAHILSFETTKDVQHMSADELAYIIRDFSNSSLTIGEIEDHLRGSM